jgi:hypothetical protein
MYNEGIKTFTANGAIAAKTRVKLTAGSTTTPPQVETAGAGEQHIGIAEYAAATTTLVAIRLRTYPGTHECVAAEAIEVGDPLYAAADGMIKDSSDGTCIGIAIEQATALNDIIEFIDFTVISTTAATISIADSGNKITGTDVEAALAEIMVGIKTAQYTIIPAHDLRLETGAAIAAFANAGADGWTQLASKMMALRWNNGGTPTDMMASFILPQDLNDAAAVVLHLMGAIVKAGGAEADSPTFTVEAYFEEVGAAPGADTDCGGTSGEFLTAATDTWQEKTLSLAAGDVPAAPTVLTIVFHPTDGELATDDFVLLPPWLEVTRKCLTS